MWTTLKSEIDESVNFYKKGKSWGNTGEGFTECRYVRRTDDYFIVYLSSNIGCDKACRFCHLTQTKQTQSNYLVVAEIIEQAIKVFDYYKTQKSAEKVHFNFMARGEPLSSPRFAESWSFLAEELEKLAYKNDLDYQINISTIMPLDYQEELMLQFTGKVSIYYSLYSTDLDFRRKWLPKAIPVVRALNILDKVQKHTGIEIKLHWAFIDGENDSWKLEGEFMGLIDYISSYCSMISGINIIEYNPFSDKQGKGVSKTKLFKLLEEYKAFDKKVFNEQLPPIKLIPRVGFDVNASCGMFVNE